MAHAMGYVLSPVPRAEEFENLLTHNDRRVFAAIQGATADSYQRSA